jgi:hypothetical protein
MQQRDATGLDGRRCRLHGRDAVVDDRGARKLRFLRLGQHQAHTAAVEEGEAGKPEQERKPQYVLVEGDGTIDVGHADGNLPDRLNLWALGRHGSLL